MLWNNDVPVDGYHSGDLFFPEVGVAVPLKGMGAVIFNGLHYHGGRPPTPMTAEAEVKDWPYRLVTVHYPHAIPLDGKAITAWMPFPTSSVDAKGLFCLRPELMHWRQVYTHTKCSSKLIYNYSDTIPDVSRIEHTSFARDGLTMMEDRSLFLFTVRSIVMFVIWSLCQLPRSWNIDVDVDLLIKSITMQRGDERIDAGVWLEAPTMAQYRLSGDNAPSHSPILHATPDATIIDPTCERSGSISRVAIHAQWNEHVAAMTRFMPHAYTTAKVPQCVESCDGMHEDVDEDIGMSVSLLY